MMKVAQMINDRGNGATNQFVIEGDGKLVFQSYDSMIAELDFSTNTITIGRDYDYSKTTGKHRNIFFRDYAFLPELATLDGLRKAIDEGHHEKWTIRKAW